MNKPSNTQLSDTRLSDLTVGEYQTMISTILSKVVASAISRPASQSKLHEDLIYMDEVLKLTGYQKPTLYSKVSRCQIPVVSRGIPLTFSRKAILQWINDGRPANSHS